MGRGHGGSSTTSLHRCCGPAGWVLAENMLLVDKGREEEKRKKNVLETVGKKGGSRNGDEEWVGSLNVRTTTGKRKRVGRFEGIETPRCTAHLGKKEKTAGNQGEVD